MKEKIKILSTEIENFAISNLQELENFRIKFIGTKGSIKDLFSDLKSVPNEEKKEIGQLMNGLRMLAEERFNQFKTSLEEATNKSETIDFSKPGEDFSIGSHPKLSLSRLNRLFQGLWISLFQVNL